MLDPISDQEAVLSRLSPLIMGGAGFSYQLHANPESLPVRTIVERAFDHGMRTIDTSPYYEPSEQLLGAALSHPDITNKYQRSEYVLMTKVGRVSEKHFNYSSAWIRQSVARSLRRFGTTYLDVVFCHDVEFVSIDEAVEAVGTLFNISKTGAIKCVGISGYDIEFLQTVALRALQRYGRPVDVVQNWAQLSLQNTKLEQKGLDPFRDAGVTAVCSASPLGVGLLRKGGVPLGALGNFHPAPAGLREVAQQAAEWVENQGDRLSSVALRFSISRAKYNSRPGFTVHTITGVSSVSDLEENIKTAKQILRTSDALSYEGSETSHHSCHQPNEKAAVRDTRLYEGVRNILGPWLDYDFTSSSQGAPDLKMTPNGGLKSKTILEQNTTSRL